MTYNSYFLFRHSTEGPSQRHVISNLARGKCSPNYKYFISSLVPIFHHFYKEEKNKQVWGANSKTKTTKCWRLKVTSSEEKPRARSLLPQRTERGSQLHVTVLGDNRNYHVHIYECGHMGFFCSIYGFFFFFISETFREEAKVCSVHITHSWRYSLSTTSYYLIQF